MKRFLLMFALLLVLVAACTSTPTSTPVPPTQTPVPPTATTLPPTATLMPPTSMPLPTATATSKPVLQQMGVKAVISDTSVPYEIRILQRLSKELGFSIDEVDYNYINDRTNWFDQNGKRKLDLFMSVGGDTQNFFTEGKNPGVDKAGCQNLRDFVSQGGSAMGIDNAGTALFTNTQNWIGPNAGEVAKGIPWSPIRHTYPGWMVQACGGEPLFRGSTTAPLETNLPYPRYRVVPVKMNTDNAIVRSANLPGTVFLTTVGAADLFPDNSQPMETLAWFADGAAAIGIVKYGSGNVYLVSPHVDLTLERDHDHFINAMTGPEADRMGAPAAKRQESIAVLEQEGDPDGSIPDLALTKALLNDAASRAISNRSVSAPATSPAQASGTTPSPVPASQLAITVTAGGAATYKFGAVTVPGYLYRPTGRGPFPAILMAHGATGLNNNIRVAAQTLSREGYVVFAPDFLTPLGIPPSPPSVAALDERTWQTYGRQMYEVLAQGLDALKTLPYVDPTRLGVVGYSTGGYYSLVLGTRSDVKAVVAYYGWIGDNKIGYVALYPDIAVKFNAPLLMLTGEDDSQTLVTTAKSLQDLMVRDKNESQLFTYPKSGHSFNFPGNALNPTAAQDAEEKMNAFFKAKLNP